MENTLSIQVDKTNNSRLNEVDFNNIPFGRVFSDHMFIADYKNGEWSGAAIKEYGKLEITPALITLHYGQAIFEGMKAYKNENGEVFLFRPMANIQRLNKSAERMCMQTIDEELFFEGLKQLVDIDSDWIPEAEGCSLYIRPFMFASDEFIGVRPSDNYKFIIFTCPVSGYYSEPVKVLVEQKYTRAAKGGVGYAKAAGNYAGALLPAKIAQDKGYHQLIWTDANEHEYIEESGTMNLMVVIDGKLITPAVSDTTLPGITRDSVLTVARHWGMTVEERPLSIKEVMSAHKEGKLTEMFGTGTAATIAHIKSICYQDEDFDLPVIENREFSNKVGKFLDDLRTGKIEDPFGWRVQVK